VPTEAPLVTPPAPATKALPSATEAPGWIRQAETAADNAKWIFAGIAGCLGVLLLIGAVRRGHSKSQSNKAMDHLEGANYRDYSAAPRRRRRSEIVSGEEEEAKPEEEAPAAEAEDAKEDGQEKEENGELMAETLKRLYDDAETAKSAAPEAAEKAEEKAGEAKAEEPAAEEPKAEEEPIVINARDASRRRRTARK
jgi:hypothetical protein